MGIDARWEDLIFVVNANGDIVERWTQWDSMLKRPHAIYISPYDAEKRVWVVDDHNHALFQFSHDGKTLLRRSAPWARRAPTPPFQPSDIHGVHARRDHVRRRQYNGNQW